MMQDDFVQLHKFLLETDTIPEISDEVREVVEQEWPELARKLPPRKPALLMFRDPRVVDGLMAFWALLSSSPGQCLASNLHRFKTCSSSHDIRMRAQIRMIGRKGRPCHLLGARPLLPSADMVRESVRSSSYLILL